MNLTDICVVDYAEFNVFDIEWRNETAKGSGLYGGFGFFQMSIITYD